MPLHDHYSIISPTKSFKKNNSGFERQLRPPPQEDERDHYKGVTEWGASVVVRAAASLDGMAFVTLGALSAFEGTIDAVETDRTEQLAAVACETGITFALAAHRVTALTAAVTLRLTVTTPPTH